MTALLPEVRVGSETPIVSVVLDDNSADRLRISLLEWIPGFAQGILDDANKFITDDPEWTDVDDFATTCERLAMAARVIADISQLRDTPPSQPDVPPGPGFTRLTVQWHPNAIAEACDVLLEYRDGDRKNLNPNSQAVMVAIDALRSIVRSMQENTTVNATNVRKGQQ